MGIGDLFLLFQEVRVEVGRMREKWGQTNGDPRHWMRVMSREMGSVGDEELGEEEPDVGNVARRMAAIAFCFLLDQKREEAIAKAEIREQERRNDGTGTHGDKPGGGGNLR